ncbi:MAG: hypothetical protein WAM71_08620 [Candidatus Korobacteraceae bacterium]
MAAKKVGTAKSNALKGGKQNASADVVAMKSVAQYPRYVSLEAREKMVARSKRAVYAHLNKITNAHINLAAKGNCQSAKFLFEFAGIDKMPALALLEKTKAAFGYPTDDDPTKAVLSFYKKLGIDPPKLTPPKPAEAQETTDGMVSVVG